MDTFTHMHIRPYACVKCSYNFQINCIFIIYTVEQSNTKLECGPMPNVMVALPNIGGAICSTPQSLADAHYLTAIFNDSEDDPAPNYPIL